MNAKTSFVPKYEEIKGRLAREISLHHRVGDNFHTQRDLMRRFNASYATIRRVLLELKNEGIIRSHVGKGIFITKIPSSVETKKIKIAVFKHDVSDATNFTIGGLYIKGLLQAQERLPCEIVFLRLTNDVDTMMKRYRSTLADGILFLEDRFTALIERIQSEGIPHIIVHPIYQKHESCVDIDDANGLKEAVAELFEAGASKLLIMVRTDTGVHNQLKLESCRLGAELAGRPAEAITVLGLRKQDDLLTVTERVRAALNNSERPDGIVVIDPRYLEMVEMAVKLENLSVPKDIRIVVFGAYGHALSSGLPIGVVSVPYVEAAETAIELLYKRCTDGDANCSFRLLKSRFYWKNEDDK